MTVPTPERPVQQIGQVYQRLGSFTESLQGKAIKTLYSPQIDCPCKEDTSHISTCRSCNGTGFFYPERLPLDLMMVPFNQSTQYYSWSLDKLGTVNISSFEIRSFAYGDRVIVLEGRGVFTERRRVANNRLPITYPITEIDRLYRYNRATNRAIKIEGGFSFEAAACEVSVDLPEGTVVSIRYQHLPMYNIIDLTREILFNNYLTNDLDLQRGDFPIEAVARRAHFQTRFGDD